MEYDASEAVFLAAPDGTGGGCGAILAPACASFDQFKNFMGRGNAFKKQIVQASFNTV